jgi:dipeptidyl aminopeptidase/acylaminoacyl peptidase
MMQTRSSRAAIVAALTLTLTACATAAPPAPTPQATAPVGMVTRSYDRVGPDDEQRTIAVEVTLPEQPGHRPAILFSHGLTALPENYAALIDAWVGAGYAVIAPIYPHTSSGTDYRAVDVLNQMADASRVLDGVLADPELAPRIDADEIAAAGHSAGGFTTVGLFTSARDDRLVAGIVLSGSALGVGDDYSGDPAPILFLHGSDDPTVPYQQGHEAFLADPWPAAFITLPGAGHIITGTDNAQFATVRDATLAFLAAALGDGSFGAVGATLQGGATIEDRL